MIPKVLARTGLCRIVSLCVSFSFAGQPAFLLPRFPFGLFALYFRTPGSFPRTPGIFARTSGIFTRPPWSFTRTPGSFSSQTRRVSGHVGRFLLFVCGG